MLAAMCKSSKMRRSRVGQKDKGDSWHVSIGNFISILARCGIEMILWKWVLNKTFKRIPQARKRVVSRSQREEIAYLSSSLSFPTSKLSSHPASMRILMPPSNSSNDCDAVDSDWAPNNGVKLNIAAPYSEEGITGRSSTSC